ncbi:MAG: regulatory protein RecX [Acetivibrio sp.]
MTITGLEKGYRKQVRIYIDEEYVFSLYENEIKRYQLEKDLEIEEELYQQILEETIFKRGKQKAMNLLERMDYTEGELRSKLKQGGFPIEIIERVIAYIHSYHYLNDQRYVENYILYKKNSKSIRQMKMELKQKGVDSELIEENFQEQKVSDAMAIQKAISKKTKDVESLTYPEKQKIASYLFRKGFQEGDIRQQLLL